MKNKLKLLLVSIMMFAATLMVFACEDVSNLLDIPTNVGHTDTYVMWTGVNRAASYDVELNGGNFSVSTSYFYYTHERAQELLIDGDNTVRVRAINGRVVSNYSDLYTFNYTTPPVGKIDQDPLVLAEVSDATFGDAPIVLSASGGSVAGNIVYEIKSGKGEIVEGNKLKINGAGSIVVLAKLSGNDTYNDVVSNEITVDVSKAIPSVKTAVKISNFEYGSKSVLQNSDFEGEIVGVDGQTLAGVFSTDYDNKLSATTHDIGFSFVPTNTDDYESYENSLSFTVSKKAINLSGKTNIDKQYDGDDIADLSAYLTELGDAKVAGDNLSLVGTYDNKNIGSAKAINITLDGTDKDNYSLSVSASGNITAAVIDLTSIVVSKEYDGNNSIDVSIFQARIDAAKVGSENVSITASYNDKTVGSPKALSIDLDGTDKGNYELANVPANGAITPKNIAVGTVSGINKEFDGGKTADLSGIDISASIIGSDAVVLQGEYASKDVANGISITLGLGGADAANYTVSGTVSGNIAKKALDLGTFANIDREYNASDVVEVSVLSAVSTALDSAKIAGTAVSIASASYDNENAGASKTITLEFAGADKDNYNITYTISGAITVKNVTIGAVVGITKEYDKTNAVASGDIASIEAALALVIISGDTVGIESAVYATVDVNGSIAITLTFDGAHKDNYNISYTISGEITVKAITLTVADIDKEYNGNNTAITTAIQDALDGLKIAGDTLTVVSATYDDKNVGTGKTITAVISGDTGNYNIIQAISGEITAKAITLTVAGVDKEYNGNNTAATEAIQTALNLLIAGDTLTVDSATYDDKNVGIGKTIAAFISGADSGNYNITQAISGEITAKAITLTVAGIDKEYNGNDTAATAAIQTALNLLIAGDALTVDSATYADKNVGAGKAIAAVISGDDSGNYNITQAISGEITVKAITLTVANVNKVYDGGNTAEITAIQTELNLLIAGDTLTVTSATYADKNVGTGKAIAAVISGADSGNYNITQAISGAITAKDIDIGVVGGITKEYDKTNAVASGDIASIEAALALVIISGDTVGIASAVYATVNVNGSIAITLTFDGADKDNYNITYTISGAITPKQIALIWDGPTLTYNGSEQHPTASFVPADIENGDTVGITYTMQASTGIDAGEHTVEAASNNANYEFTASTATKTYTIAPAPIVFDASDYEQNQTVVATGSNLLPVFNGVPVGVAVAINNRGGGTFSGASTKGTYELTIVFTNISSNYVALNESINIDFIILPNTLDAVSASQVDNERAVTWTDVDDATHYYIYIGDTEDNAVAKFARGATYEYILDGVANTYSVYVVAVIEYGTEQVIKGAVGTPVEITVSQLAAVAGLVYDDTTNTLSWTENTNAESYTVEIYEAGSPDTLLETRTGINTNSCLIDVADGTYTFRVYAIAANNSIYINSVAAELSNQSVTPHGVDQAAVSLQDATVLNGLTYGDGAVTLVGAGGSGTGAFSYKVTAGADVVSISGDQMTIIGAGEATVVVHRAGSNDSGTVYKAIDSDGYNFTVAQKAVDVNAWHADKNYEGNINPITEANAVTSLDGVVNGDNVYPLFNVSTFSYINAGEYQLTVNGLGGDDASKYTIDNASNLTHTIKINAIEAQLVLSSGEFTYSGVDQFANIVVGVSNKIGSDAFAITISQIEIKNANTYVITVTALGNSNYKLPTDATLQVVVNKAQLSVEWSIDPLIYTSTQQSPTATLNGAVNEETLDIAYNITNGINVLDTHSVTITVSGDTSGNYEFSNNTLTSAAHSYTIGKANQEALNILSDEGNSVSFDKGSLQLTVTGGSTSGTISYDSDNDDVATVDTDGKVTFVAVGTVVITVTMAGGDNYNDVVDTITIEITKANQEALNIVSDKGNSVSFDKGSLQLTVTGGSTGGTKGYVSSNEGIATVDVDGKVTFVAVGEVVITVTMAGNGNYEDAVGEITIVITLGTQTITINDVGALTYGDDPITLSVDGKLGSGAVTYTVEIGKATIEGSELTITGAGSVTIKAVVAADNKYGTAENTLTFNVEKKTITIDWAADREYDGYETTLNTTATLYGAVGDDEVFLIISSIDGIKKAGEYTIEVTGLDGGNKDNYKLPEVKIHTYTINKRTVAFEAVIAGDTLVYDGTDHYSKISAVVTNKVLTDTVNLTLDTVEVKNAGSKDIAITTVSNPNYKLPDDAKITVEVEKKTLSVDWSSETFTYSGSQQRPTATLTGVVDGETLNFTYNVTNGVNVSDAHSVTITVDGATSGNYEFANGTLTSAEHTYSIGKGDQAALSISADKGTTGGDGVSVEITENELQLTVGGGSSGGSVSYSSSNEAVATVDAEGKVTFVAVGTVVITVTMAGNGNYNNAVGQITINITLVAQTIEITGVSTSQTYGDAPFTLGVSGASGTGAVTYVIDSGSNASLSGTGNKTLTITGVGTFVVKAAIEADSQYAAATATITVVVGAKQLTINWAGNKEYDGTQIAPSDVAVLDGVVGQDDVSLVFDGSTATAIKDAGTYAITATGLTGAKAANYTLGGTLNHDYVISQIEVAFLASGNALVYDGTNQYGKIGVAVTNAANDESITLTLEVKEIKNAGSYDVNITEVSDTTNYKLPVNAKITVEVEKKTLDVEWSSEPLTYTGVEQHPTATLTGVVEGELASLTLSYTVVGGIAVGGGHTVKVTVGGAGSGNYMFAGGGLVSAEHTYSIALGVRTATIGGIDGEVMFNTAPYTLAATPSVGGGTASFEITAGENAAIDGDQLTISGVGQFTITATITADDNYGEVSATLTVTVSAKKLDMPANVRADSTIANKILWDAVEGASGYRVLATDSNEATTTYTVESVTEYIYVPADIGTYTITIRALGTGNYTNSEVSLTSVELTFTKHTTPVILIGGDGTVTIDNADEFDGAVIQVAFSASDDNYVYGVLDGTFKVDENGFVSVYVLAHGLKLDSAYAKVSVEKIAPQAGDVTFESNEVVIGEGFGAIITVYADDEVDDTVTLVGGEGNDTYNFVKGDASVYVIEVVLTKAADTVFYLNSDAVEFVVAEAGSGTEEDPYIIDSAEKFVSMLNDEDNYNKEGTYFKQVSDIVLDGNVRADVSVNYFRGVYDGNNCKITRTATLVPSAGDVVLWSIFDYIAPTGVVKNLKVEFELNRELNTTTVAIVTAATYDVGGLAARNQGMVDNVQATGTFTAHRYSNVGGIVGLNSGTIKDSSFSGTINGWAWGSVGGGAIGGIAGCQTNGSIENCVASGAVTGNETAGGIAGFVGKGTITICKNNAAVVTAGFNAGGIAGTLGESVQASGAVTIISDSVNKGAISGYSFVGGIIGLGNCADYDNNLQASVIKCINNGAVTATAGVVGGIAGMTRGSITLSANFGTVTLSSITAVSVGFVNPNWTHSTSAAGGIVGFLNTYANGANNGWDGYFNGGYIGFCYNMGEIVTPAVGGVAGGIYGESYGRYIHCSYSTDHITGETVGTIAGKSYDNNSSKWGDIVDCIGYTNSEMDLRGATNASVNTTGTISATAYEAAHLLVLGDSFVEDTGDINGGYPMLAWQVPSEE